MHKQRIYIDTSVIGGCFDEEFAEWSNKLFDEFISGKKIAVISQTTFDELKNAPNHVKKKLNDVPEIFLELLNFNEEIDLLAKQYLNLGAVSIKYFDDAIHIAYSTYYNVDFLVSWNFKHIVNIYRIQKYNSINLVNGYKYLEIRTPREVLINEED
jgi:hypothetical protein